MLWILILIVWRRFKVQWPIYLTILFCPCKQQKKSYFLQQIINIFEEFYFMLQRIDLKDSRFLKIPLTYQIKKIMNFVQKIAYYFVPEICPNFRTYSTRSFVTKNLWCHFLTCGSQNFKFSKCDLRTPPCNFWAASVRIFKNQLHMWNKYFFSEKYFVK